MKLRGGEWVSDDADARVLAAELLNTELLNAELLNTGLLNTGLSIAGGTNSARVEPTVTYRHEGANTNATGEGSARDLAARFIEALMR